MSEIKLLPSSTTYPRKFKQIKNRIQKTTRMNLDIHHAGSTAVPGMQGKGVIDILIGIRNWKEGNQLALSLRRLGFIRGEANRGRVFLSLRKGMDDIHLHLVRKGTKQYNDFLALRNYLAANAGERRKYLKLKKKIYPLWIRQREEYLTLKDRYIKSLLRRINTKTKTGSSWTQGKL